jgi:hypothetical protein
MKPLGPKRGILVRNCFAGAAVASIAALVFSPVLHPQSQSTAPATSKAASSQRFDAHDMTGTWRGEVAHPGYRDWASYDQTIPEPPLTDWAKQHLLYKSISHDSLGGTPLPDKDRPGHICPNNQDPCYSADPNGVPTNDINGEYPAKDCEPLSTPAMYDYASIGPMEILLTREGDRMFQFFEYHREWRTWWLNRDHPKDLDPTYEGDSTARWNGNTLVVDTIGYNSKTMITQNVGHSKSESFHLVERFTLTDHDHMTLDMTYYDPQAWGDKSWPGFRKYVQRAPKEDFDEFICSPREYQEYNKRVAAPLDGHPQ